MKTPFPGDIEKTQEAPENFMDREIPDQVAEQLRQQKIWAGQQGCLGRAMSPTEILAELFSYHPPNEVTIPKYAAINQAAKNFAEIVLANCPRGADFSRVIQLIQDARMTANRAITLNGLSL